VAVRRAREGTLFNARTLDGAGRWIRGIQRVRDRGPGRGTPIWVTETGHALYGGQPGLSNTWVSTPWWVDQLAAMAHEGVDTVFRQSLVGSDYGLLEEGTFSPRPDYHVSFLWKKLIGTNVYARPKVKGPDRKLRVWRMGGRDGIPWVILVNLDQNRAAAVNWGRPAGRRFVLGPETGPRSFRLTLNGVTVDDRLEELWGTDYLVKRHFLSSPPAGAGPENLVLPPLGCAFVEVP
jgi:heparanase 1